MSDESPPARRLVELYRSYIGEPDRRVDVYLGFGLFFASVVLGILALAVFVYGTAVSLDVYVYRRPAFALGMASLPLALLAIIVLLPVDRRGNVTGVLGGLVCFAAVGAFWWAYPFHWDAGSGPTYSLEVMLGYGAGLTVLLSSTGAALVAYHVDRAKPHPAEVEPVEEDDPEESYSDEEIQDDIEQAMSDVDLNWGGVAETDNTSLSFSADVEELDTSGMQVEATRVERDGVDDQVHGLKTIKGTESKTARSETTVDDQTAQLADLRKRKREEEATDDEAGVRESVASLTDTLRSRLSSLRPR